MSPMSRKLCLVVCLTLAFACGKKDSDKTPASETATPAAASGDQPQPSPDLIKSSHDAEMAKNKAPKTMTAAVYEPLMLALKSCSIDGISISNGCPAKRALVTARRDSRTTDDVKVLAVKHLKHKSVPVRVHAAGMMKTFFGATHHDVEAALEAAKTETHPAVLAKLIRALQSKQPKNLKVAEMIATLSKNESPLVRAEAVNAMLTTFANDVDGSFKAALAIVESDSDPMVRERGCRKLGRRVDDSALPLLKKLTDKKMAATDVKLYTACWEGLVRMAVSHPFFDKSSKAAFDLVIMRLAPPCSKETPPWKVMSILGNLTDKKLMAVAPWIEEKLPSARKALSGIVLCKEANWIARNGAVDALTRIGTTKEELTGLAKKLAKLKADEHGDRVQKKLASATK